jgi:hypothetical protein
MKELFQAFDYKRHGVEVVLHDCLYYSYTIHHKGKKTDSKMYFFQPNLAVRAARTQIDETLRAKES